MRTVTSAMKTALSTAGSRPFLFAYLDTPDAPSRFWIGPGGHDISWNSQTWLGTYHTVGFSRVTTSGSGAPQQVEIQFGRYRRSPADGEIAQDLVTRFLSLNLRDRELAIWQACLADDGSVIADPFILYRGWCQQRRIIEQEGSFTLSVMAASELEDGDRTSEYRHSPAHLAALGYPNDKSFSYISRIEQFMIKWPGAGYWRRMSSP